jgi:flagellin
MSLVINTNNIATIATNNLNANQVQLQRSLARLSSGSKIVAPHDDAGGLAVSTKLKAALNRNTRTQQNVSNAISFMQTQDGALKVATGILDRMSELKTMSIDPTKNAFDIANYNTEFKELQAQLVNINDERFNGINLFDGDQDLSVSSTEDGVTGKVNMTRNGLFDNLSETGLAQTVIATAAYVATDNTDSTAITIATPTHGKTTTITLDASTGSSITAAMREINTQLALAEITTVKATETYDGKIQLEGTEKFTVAETAAGAYAGLGLSADNTGTVSTYNSVAKTYNYEGLGTYAIGDVVAGTRADGSKEAYLVTAAVTGIGGSFDTFASTSSVTRLENNTNPNAQILLKDGATSYALGDVAYNDDDGRYYLASAAAGTTALAAGANIFTTPGEFISLGDQLPTVSDHAAYDASQDYQTTDIVSFDGNLYFATGNITNGNGDPVVDNTNSWTKLNIAVGGRGDLLDQSTDLANFETSDFISFLQTAATTRAQNGAEMQRLHVSNEMLETNYQNLEAANSRLQDVDVAQESTRFARYNILVQSATAMLAQANASQSIALQLLQ